MNILKQIVGGKVKLVVQGMGNAGKYHTYIARDFGTDVGAGVTPGKGGSFFEDIPIFDSVREAKEQTKVNATVIYVPAKQGHGLCFETLTESISKKMPIMQGTLTSAAEAIIEAIYNEIRLIVCITDGIPQKDMRFVRAYLSLVNSYLRLQNRQISFIGPNTAGVVFPWERVKIGIMPNKVIKAGNVATASRSGSLTYDIAEKLLRHGLGQSAIIGIGGDSNRGLGLVDCLELFQRDDRTKAVCLVGEIGGNEEMKAAEAIERGVISKPVMAYVVGVTAPKGKIMGHAGAVNKEKGGSAQEKKEALKSVGVLVADSIVEIPKMVRSQL